MPALLAGFLALVAAGCLPSSPYDLDESAGKVYYTDFDEDPKTLDPATSYSVVEYEVLAEIYEPPLQYHYLKWPYELIPNTAEAIPAPVYFDAAGKVLPGDPPGEQVARAVYRIRIQPGIEFQDHPCFAQDEHGRYRYHELGTEGSHDYRDISEFEHTGTRELKAVDYAFQIKRMADPDVSCPILALLESFIEGLPDYAKALREDLAAERERRRLAGGIGYSQEADERENPIRLDYDAHPLPGVRVIDDHTYEVVLTRKYPQFVFWLAMPFFSPLPWEADRFYKQGPLAARNITIRFYPVGTGAFRMEKFLPSYRVIMVRNENFRGERYPTEGSPGDAEAGLLADAGQPMPYIDKVVRVLEKEAIPRWNKFMLGYYDNALEIKRESFDAAVQMSSKTGIGLSPAMLEKGIRLTTATQMATMYFAFNLDDDVVGGYTPERRKLRKAIALAVDTAEYIQIFENGRGIEAQGPIPPGVFGYEEGSSGIDPTLFTWNETLATPRRKPLDEAKRLLAEAGYAGGQGRDGKPLILNLDTSWVGAEYQSRKAWLQKQFEKLGIVLVDRATDYNRFQEKADQGNWQILSWGWYADYPDPENFLFLLYGPNGKVQSGGENNANYASEEFDKAYQRMETMVNGPERLELIRRCLAILREDTPWFNVYHPKAFALQHAWFGNFKQHLVANNTLKYKRIDPDRRRAYQERWAHPVWWPLIALGIVLMVTLIPAWLGYKKRERAGAVT